MYWLFKTEPGTYSWSDLVKSGRETWDGVLNPLAQKNLRLVGKRDGIFIYHTGAEKAIVGIAQAVSGGYADPSDKSGKLTVVDIMPKEPLPRPVPLSLIKSNPKLRAWDLVRLPRLSVMPVSNEIWQEVLRLS